MLGKLAWSVKLFKPDTPSWSVSESYSCLNLCLSPCRALILVLFLSYSCCVDLCPCPRSTYLFVFSYAEHLYNLCYNICISEKATQIYLESE
jgi:hypothetical protein